MDIVLVFLGAGLGGVARHLVNGLAARLAGVDFPWGTFAINIAGSLAMGVLAGTLALRGGASAPAWRLFLGTGVLGGFTTFSTFSLDAATLWQRGEGGAATLYATGSVAAGLLALFAGLWLSRGLFA